MANKLELKYFVLKPNMNDIYGKASIAAMRTYAAIIADENPEFAQGIENWAYHAELGPKNEYAEEQLEEARRRPSMPEENQENHNARGEP